MKSCYQIEPYAGLAQQSNTSRQSTSKGGALVGILLELKWPFCPSTGGPFSAAAPYHDVARASSSWLPCLSLLFKSKPPVFVSDCAGLGKNVDKYLGVFTLKVNVVMVRILHFVVEVI